MIGMFDQYRNEGLDAILLRKRKTSFGDHKRRSGGNNPDWKNAPRGTGVKPYTTPKPYRRPSL